MDYQLSGTANNEIIQSINQSKKKKIQLSLHGHTILNNLLGSLRFFLMIYKLYSTF